MTIKIDKQRLAFLGEALFSFEYTKMQNPVDRSVINCYITHKQNSDIQMILRLHFRIINNKHVVFISMPTYKNYRKISRHKERLFLSFIGILNFYPDLQVDEIAIENNPEHRSYGAHWADGIYEALEEKLSEYTNLVIIQKHRDCLEFEGIKWFGFEVKEDK